MDGAKGYVVGERVRIIKHNLCNDSTYVKEATITSFWDKGARLLSDDGKRFSYFFWRFEKIADASEMICEDWS